MNKLTTRERNLLFAAIFLTFGVVIWIYVIQPTWQQYGQDNLRLAELNTRLAELKKFEKILQENPDAKTEQAKIAEVDKQLPNAPESAELLYYLQTKARSKGAVLVEYLGEQKENPQEKQSQDAGQGSATAQKVLPFTVKVAGTYDAIIGFLQELEKFPRIVWVQQGEIRKKEPQTTGSNYGPIEANFAIESYYLPQNRPYQDNVVPKPPIRGKANPF